MIEKISRIATLSSIIKQDVELIDSYLKFEGLPSPSFAVDAASDFPLPISLLEAQRRILESCTELQALIEGPRAYLNRITSPRINILMSLQAIYQYKIATSFSDEVAFEELARRCSVDEDQLRRLLRMAISYNIFCEPRKGAVAHTALSKLIADDNRVLEWIGLVCDEMWPTGCKTIPAITKWPGSEEPNETGFALANDGVSFWDALKEDPQRARRFATGMQYLQTHPGFGIEHLVNLLGWDVESSPEAMVDLGGSQGMISKELLERYPRLRCHVQDVPEAMQGAVARKDGRLTFSPHNFFAEQPVKNADVYFLRSVLHNWSDKYAIQIVRNLIPALKDEAKVIINEVCLPEPNILPAYHSQMLRGYDLSMLQLFNSKERDCTEWENLFKEADGRFKLNRIMSNPQSFLSVIEFLWLPGNVSTDELVAKERGEM